MEEREEKFEPKKKEEEMGKYNDNQQFAPSELSDSKEGVASRTDWALV